jgi:hypothetical protein
MGSVDRDRLGKLLGMLGSRHDAEVVSAARMANTMVRDAEATWAEVLNQGAVAETACLQLLAENQELRARLDELHDRVSKVANSGTHLGRRFLEGVQGLAMTLLALAIAFGGFGLVAGLLVFLATLFGLMEPRL